MWTTDQTLYNSDYCWDMELFDSYFDKICHLQKLNYIFKVQC